MDGAQIWFQMAAYTYRDRQNLFRNTIIKNRLQNVLLEIYDKMQRFAIRQTRKFENTTRQMELFHRFAALVYEYCAQEREVAFYADKFCISTRYLSTIVRTVAHLGQGVYRSGGDAGDSDDARSTDFRSAGDCLSVEIPRPVLSGAFLQEARRGSPPPNTAMPNGLNGLKKPVLVGNSRIFGLRPSPAPRADLKVRFSWQ